MTQVQALVEAYQITFPAYDGSYTNDGSFNVEFAPNTHPALIEDVSKHLYNLDFTITDQGESIGRRIRRAEFLESRLRERDPYYRSKIGLVQSHCRGLWDHYHNTLKVPVRPR